MELTESALLPGMPAGSFLSVLFVPVMYPHEWLGARNAQERQYTFHFAARSRRARLRVFSIEIEWATRAIRLTKGKTLGIRRERYWPVFSIQSSPWRRESWVFSWILDLVVCLLHRRANPLWNLTHPRRCGGSQGRGSLARSRLIGGRGLSTNPRPALCFSHHPWRYRGYPT